MKAMTTFSLGASTKSSKGETFKKIKAGIILSGVLGVARLQHMTLGVQYKDKLTD